MKQLLLLIFLLLIEVFVQAQTTDAQGKKQGYWKKRDEKTNHLIYEGKFKDDQPIGTFKYYHINDSVRAIIYFKEGSKTSHAKLFHMNGKRMAEGKYVGREIKDSVWTYYDENGQLLSRETYLNGKKNGKSFVYFPNGDISEERNFKNGLEEGSYKEYFEKNSMRAQGTYLNGEKEGKFTYYFPNHVEVAAGYFKNGHKNGPWIYRSEKGVITEKELYKNGILANQKETDAFFAKNKPQTQTPKAETKNPAGQKPSTPKTTTKK